MDTKILDYGAAIAALYFVLQILKIVLDFRTKKSGPFNGSTQQILDILARLADTSSRQVVILEGTRTLHQANGQKLDNISTSLQVAMERQKTQIESLKELTHKRKGP